ncbi:MAG: sensor domain-containing protein [Halorientalis sp.]
MTDTALPRTGLSRPSLWSVVGVPFRLQTYRNLLYLSLAFPLGLTYFLLVTIGLSLGVGLAITLVGVPLLLAVLAATMGLTWFERHLTVLLLGIDIEPPTHPVVEREGLGDRITALVTDLGIWKGVVYLVSKFVIGIASFALIVSMLATAVAFLTAPLFYRSVRIGVFLPKPMTLTPSIKFAQDLLLVGVDAVVRLSSWRVDSLGDALVMSALGVVFLVVALNLLNGLAWLAGRYTRFILGARKDAQTTA